MRDRRRSSASSCAMVSSCVRARSHWPTTQASWNSAMRGSIDCGDDRTAAMAAASSPASPPVPGAPPISGHHARGRARWEASGRGLPSKQARVLRHRGGERTRGPFPPEGGKVRTDPAGEPEVVDVHRGPPPYTFSFLETSQPMVAGASPEPSSFCGVYSTSTLEKLSVTFSVRRSSPPEPPVVDARDEAVAHLDLDVFDRALAGLPHGQRRLASRACRCSRTA